MSNTPNKALRQFSPADRLIQEFDRGLRVVTLQRRTTSVAYPAQHMIEDQLSLPEQVESARLMRVNHAGEIAAHGLYHCQALTARNQETLRQMETSAQEELNHLAWCETRLAELKAPRSLLSPFWYVTSYLLGATAGWVGDRWSLGFVAETEAQVEHHLDNHLGQLSLNDNRSRAILEQMRDDERHHGDEARKLGAYELPKPIKKIMTLVSKCMTSGAYWI